MRFLEALGGGLKRPERASEILSTHAVLRATVLVSGLFAFSRMITVAIDVHRWGFLGPVDGITGLLLGSVNRGSIWHSVIIAACGVLVPVGSCAITAVVIGKRAGISNQAVLVELLLATLIRLPIVLGGMLCAFYIAGVVFPFDATWSLIAWTGGFAFSLMDAWRVAGKVALVHGMKPRLGVGMSILSFLISLTAGLGIILAIGGLQ